jgi:hypothetical protein
MAYLKNLGRVVEVQQAVVPATKSTGALTPVAVDAQGFDRVRYVVELGAFGTSASFDAEITESATSGGSYTLITGSGMTAATGAKASKVILIDVPVNSAKPYQKVRATATTQTVGVSAVALCYGGSGTKPTTEEDSAESIFVA